MIIMVKIKNVIQRGNTYHFCMVVPEDCVEVVGKTAIVKSLWLRC